MSQIWKTFQMFPPNTVGGKGITAVSRIPNSMEIWWIGHDRSVQGAYWYENMTEWKRYTLSSAQSASLEGGITAISRVPNSMEIWWVAPDHSVQAAYWYEGDQWKRYELAPANSAAKNARITAISRVPNSMEIWWVGLDRSVQAAYWYEGDQWKRYELAPANSASLEGGIAAISRIPNSLEVRWVAPDHSVQAAYWNEGDQWKRYELAPANSAAKTAGIAIVSRVPNSLEMWWVGLDRSVQAAYWYEGGQLTRYILAPAESASIDGAITAVSRIPGSMEVWWVTPDNSLQAAYWYENMTEWKRYGLVPANRVAKNREIASLSRIPTSMELWWSSIDGAMHDSSLTFEVITLRANIVTAEGFPLGGEVEVTIREDGFYEFKGFMRATGFTSYHYHLQVFIRGADNVVVAAQQTGRVFGFDTPGDRQKDWYEAQPNSHIRDNWEALSQNPVLECHLDANISGVTGTAWDILKTTIEALVANIVLGPSGLVLVIGSELGSATGANIIRPGTLAGTIVVGGMVFIYGPGILFPAIVAGIAVGAVVEGDIGFRSLRAEEREFATKIFGSTIPFERIRVTNLSKDGRAFVFPNLDGSILMNMNDHYDDPVHKPRRDTNIPGQTFVHEFVHVWQIENSSFMPGFICEGIQSSGDYDYDSPSWYEKAWSEFGIEEQATIVAEWYARHYSQLDSPGTLNDRAFRYIRDNLRKGEN
jgi:hypothetical protein